jgi:hypothetical protein
VAEGDILHSPLVKISLLALAKQGKTAYNASVQNSPSRVVVEVVGEFVWCLSQKRMTSIPK